MRARLLRFCDNLRSSFWFVPALMTAAAIGLSFAMIVVDQQVRYELIEGYWWIYTGGAEGARAVLAAVAGSVITVAGVVFSITIASLTLASSQFGPRLLRNFMRDLGNQIVLGTFIATFLYCLLVLRTVRGSDHDVFVPHVAVTFGVVLAVASLGVLIYFIHHVAQSIQVANVIAAVGRDLDDAIARLFPEKLGHGAGQPGEQRFSGDPPDGFDDQACPVAAGGSGYVQTIDNDGLLGMAVENDLLLCIRCRPGSFVVEGSDLATVRPKECADDKLAEKINGAFVLGAHRTTIQDVEFAVNQLVEVAVRALSPGINDPFTAIMCVDRLGAALCRLADRVIPSPCRFDNGGRLRVIAHPMTFADAVDAAFHQIRQYGRTSVAVMIRLLETITAVAAHVRREEDRAALLRHAALIERASTDGLPEEADREEVAERYKVVLQALGRHDVREPVSAV